MFQDNINFYNVENGSFNRYGETQQIDIHLYYSGMGYNPLQRDNVNIFLSIKINTNTKKQQKFAKKASEKHAWNHYMGNSSYGKHTRSDYFVSFAQWI